MVVPFLSKFVQSETKVFKRSTLFLNKKTFFFFWKSTLPPNEKPSNIKIMKADKGNWSVVTNTKDFDGKLLALLNDCEVYRLLSTGNRSFVSVEKKKIN